MEILPLLCVVSLAFTGLTKGVGVLPDGPLNATVGGTVTFTTTLTPTETPFFAIDWKFGAKDIISFNVNNITAPEYEGRVTLFMSTASLELRDLTDSDTGEYRVLVTPYGEPIKEGSTTLRVYVPVSGIMVTVNSTDLVESNSTVRLSCTSSGSSLSFLWLNGSSEVTASDRVQLTDGGSSLTIVNVTRYDRGPFKCRVCNPVSNDTSDPINLNISFGPENVDLERSPSQEHYEKGSNIILSCSAVSTPPATFSWSLNGDLLPDTGPELRLMNIQMHQRGNYSCHAFNQKTNRYSTSQLSAVSLLKRISGASITSSTNLPIEGNSINLTCEAAGSVFTRVWMKAGSDLILVDSRVLSFEPVKKTDSGEYSCKISNPINTEEATYIMDVKYGPEKVQIAGPHEINFNQTLKLTCSAESKPSASYTWTLNGTEIHNSSVFTKHNPELSDSGNYTCQAMNHVTGRTSSAVHQLSVTATPDETSSCSAGCIAGIVIGCFVIVGGAAGVGFYIYRQKKPKKISSNRNSVTITGNEGRDNTTFSRNEELNYADISAFHKKDGGTVELGLQNDSSENAPSSLNNNPPAASSPPTYEVHLQRMKKAAPQADDDGAQIYTQVRKN